ncbi:MAG: DEAD/DEAH box helicase [Pseudomonadota bacterium]
MVTFSDLGLSQKVLSAVEDAGYATPTPIQAGAIPPALARRDLLGIAQTGTGKTASFVLPMLNLLEKGRARQRMPRTLILEPTRELAAQVEENFVNYGKYHKLNIALLIGGVSFDDQDRKLERGADVLIATPGRLLDHFERGKLLLTGVEIFVIDEADRMLDMGFIPDIERIAKLIPFTRQTLFFSATMPPEIQTLADRFLQNPEEVKVAPPATAATTVEQRLVAAGGKDFEKRAVLRDLIREQADLKNAIIFCNRKRDVSDLFRSLERHEFNVGALHGDMDQRARMTMLHNFREGNLKLLVASDVAARGLDIPDVSHVFNFDVPIHAEDYVHRIGRTGRAGRAGQAFTLVTKRDAKFVDSIENLIGEKIERHNEEGFAFSRQEDETEKPKSKTPATAKPKSASRKKVAEDQASVSEKMPASARKKDNAATNDNDDRRRRRRSDIDDQPTPIGFGDDIPAFMMIGAKH